MGGSLLKKIEALASRGALEAARRFSYNPPSISREAFAAYRTRIERTGSPADGARFKRAIQAPSVIQFFKLK